MRVDVMGKVLVPVRIENHQDAYEADRGLRTPDQVRHVEVPNALVDTGATFLSMPRSLVEQLGLRCFRKRRAKTSGGIVEFNMYDVVKLIIQGRDCFVEVAEVPEECPVLIGQIPLEALDFVVDPVGQRLIGNPDHGGEHMMDMF